MAEGTSISKPIRLAECVAALRASKGGAVRVTEKEMADATLEMAQLGLYTEPTCAQAAAAYHELLVRGVITKGQTTVIVLTSTGIKATPRIASLIGVTL